MIAFYWPAPEEFKPDRFIDTETYKYDRDAFIPFSSGARSCVGRKFAEVEMVGKSSSLEIQAYPSSPEHQYHKLTVHCFARL